MFDPLRLLQIHSDIRGMIQINGTFAGETGKTTFVLQVPRQRFLFSFLPLEQKNGIPLCFARMIDLSSAQPVVEADDGCLRLFFHGQDLFCTIHPPCIAQEPLALPYLLAKRSGDRLSASLYFDRTYNFLLESHAGAPLLARQFSRSLPKHPEIITHALPQGSLILAKGETEKGEKLLCCTSDARLLFCEYIHSFDLANEGIVVYQKADSLCPALLARSFSWQGEEEHFLLPENAQPSLRLLVLAVQYGNCDLAMACLAPALQSQLQFADLQEFFGAFSGFFDAFPSEDCFLVYPISKSVASLRQFSCEFADRRIANILEK